jgi:hypothetical protein
MEPAVLQGVVGSKPSRRFVDEPKVRQRADGSTTGI